MNKWIILKNKQIKMNIQLWTQSPTAWTNIRARTRSTLPVEINEAPWTFWHTVSSCQVISSKHPFRQTSLGQKTPVFFFLSLAFSISLASWCYLMQMRLPLIVYIYKPVITWRGWANVKYIYSIVFIMFSKFFQWV